MKIFVLFSLVLLASCEFEFDPKTFDWTSVKPISQTKAYREAFPHLSAGYLSVEDSKVFREREGRIIRGEIAKPYDFPFQVR